MELNGFMIVPKRKELFKIKVGTLIAEHPVLIKESSLYLRHLCISIDMYCKHVAGDSPTAIRPAKRVVLASSKLR